MSSAHEKVILHRDLKPPFMVTMTAASGAGLWFCADCAADESDGATVTSPAHRDGFVRDAGNCRRSDPGGSDHQTDFFRLAGSLRDGQGRRPFEGMLLPSARHRSSGSAAVVSDFRRTEQRSGAVTRRCLENDRASAVPRHARSVTRSANLGRVGSRTARSQREPTIRVGRIRALSRAAGVFGCVLPSSTPQ